MRICFDLDGVICNNTYGSYENAEPYQDMVDLVNELYSGGHYIIINTARGSGKFNGNLSHIMNQWYNLTQSQLNKWNLRYHELHLGKIEANIYVDDRGFRVNDDGMSAKDLRKFINDK